MTHADLRTRTRTQELPALGGAGAAPWDAARGERLRDVWARGESAWAAAADAARVAAQAPDDAGGVLLIADALTLAAVLCHALVRAAQPAACVH